MSSQTESAHARALDALGWSSFFQSQLAALPEGLTPARVALASRGRCQVFAAAGVLDAVVAGRLAHATADDADLPAVGDWVALRLRAGEGPHPIQHVLARRTCFARRAPGRRTERQVVAANVDRVLVVTSVGPDFSPRRLERYLAAAAESGAVPAIVLGKADLTDEPARYEESVSEVASGVPRFVVSALRGDGVEALRATLRPGETVALLGSSGVGKSALANALLGDERQSVGAIRERDGRGQHTTTRRELVVLPGGALLVDTPGMRELALWSDDDPAGADRAGAAPSGAFADIEALAAECRFRDCAHRTEPGCRVAEAIARGEITAERKASYEKLGRELERLRRSQDGRARQEEHRRRARFTKAVRARPKK